MCCVNPSPSASATSSQRGQIVSLESSDSPDSPESLNQYSEDCSLSPPPSFDSDEEFYSRPAKRSRAENGGGSGGGGDAAAEDERDRISELPDAILLLILSHLPLRDAGRTAALSWRWRRLFDQSLLDFNARQPFPPEEGRDCAWVIRSISSILKARPRVRIRSFRVVMYGQGFIESLGVGAVGAWFRDLARRGARELDVDMLYTAPRSLLPASLLRFASLETLRVNCCDFPDEAPGGKMQLPALKILDLSNVGNLEHSLHDILSHCPSLECVKLKNFTRFDKICLRSKSLVRLFGDFGNLKELVVEDAPNLEELVGIGLPSGNAKVNIVSAPKLQVLGYLGMSVQPLVFDGGIVQSRTLMCSVKTLAIQVPFSEKGYTIFVAQLLKCFPCLDALYVESDSRPVSRSVNIEEWHMETSIQCIEHSISKLVFENFGGEEYQWGFLTFLLGMARALKVVEFYCSGKIDWASNQIKLIDSIERVSPDAEFQFFRSCEPVSSLYLCHCCPRRCQKENRVSLL